MPHFAKRIFSGGSSPEFHFNRIFTVSGVRYHVSVKSISNKSHHFMMQEKNGSWMFSDESIIFLVFEGSQKYLKTLKHQQLFLRFGI